MTRSPSSLARFTPAVVTLVLFVVAELGIAMVMAWNLVPFANYSAEPGVLVPLVRSTAQWSILLAPLTVPVTLGLFLLVAAFDRAGGSIGRRFVETAAVEFAFLLVALLLVWACHQPGYALDNFSVSSRELVDVFVSPPWWPKLFLVLSAFVAIAVRALRARRPA
jgi:hypothetical protein